MRVSTVALSLLSLAAGALAEPAVAATPSSYGDVSTSVNTFTSTRTVFMVTTQTKTGTPPTATAVSSGLSTVLPASNGTIISNTISVPTPSSTGTAPIFTGAASANTVGGAIVAIAAGAAAMLAL